MVDMVIKKKNLWKAKGEEIAKQRKFLGYTQEEMVSLAEKNYRIKISLRNLQNAEASKEIGVDTLNAIAYFLDKELEDLIEGSTTIDNIAVNPNQKDDLIETSSTHNVNAKIFASQIKNNKTFRTEKSYLTRVDNYNQVIHTIKKSKKRKIFYPFNPSQKEVAIIKKTLTELTQIHESIFGRNNFDFSSSQEHDTDDYNQLKDELQSLTKISDFSECINELKKNNLNIYVGNFEFYSLETKALDPWALKEIDIGDPNGIHWEGEYTITLKSENYAIFCFEKTGITSMTFNYDNEWYKEKLEKIISIDPFTSSGTDYEAEQRVMEHYYDNYNYQKKFQKIKANLSKTDLTELLTPEEIEEIGFQYELDKAEDMAGQLASDISRGK
jgi:hypothetical protein